MRYGRHTPDNPGPFYIYSIIPTRETHYESNFRPGDLSTLHGQTGGIPYPRTVVGAYSLMLVGE